MVFRNIEIRAVLNGYIVTCGCQTLVFESGTTLIDHLNEYMADPSHFEAMYLKTLAEVRRARLINPEYLAGPIPLSGNGCDVAPAAVPLSEPAYREQRMHSEPPPLSVGTASEAPNVGGQPIRRR